MNRHIRDWIITSIFLFCAGCASIVRVDGPYEGKVIDAETSQPVVGAVVLGTWYKAYSTPAGENHDFYDTYEVITDENGEFRIPGQGSLVLSQIDVMMVTIFKAGYEQFPGNTSWKSLKSWGINDRITWQRDKATFKLHRMTLEERVHRLIVFPAMVPYNKERLMIIEHNKENTEIGLPSSTLLPVE